MTVTGRPPARRPRHRAAGDMARRPPPGPAGAPVSMTRPRSRTTMSSAASASRRRCDTTSTVRPRAASRPTASRIDISLSASRCEVASSRMTSHASARNARAIASRWRWPPLSRRPSSPTGVSKPLGSAAMKRLGAGLAGCGRPGRRRSRRGGRGARLSATVPWNRCGRCGTHATCARHDPRSMLASGISPTRIRPASGSTKRSSRFATVVLPAPVAPTSAVTPATADDEVEAVECRSVRARDR